MYLFLKLIDSYILHRCRPLEIGSIIYRFFLDSIKIFLQGNMI